ncbi:MAG TPA: GNAT family N-acetyltransferase [Vicinamibacterales bacterium]
MLSATEAPSLRPAVATSIGVECIDDLAGFAALRPEWNALLRSSGADGPFLTWEWLHTWWKHLRGTSALRIFTVRAGDELIAVAPLRVSRGTLAWFTQLEFLGTGHAGSDYLDLIARRGHEDQAIRAIATVVQSQRGGGKPDAPTALRLDHVPYDSLASRLATALSTDSWDVSIGPGGTCPIVRLAGHDWDSYLATLGSAHRANVRRRLKALGQRFDVRFELVVSEEQRRAALAALVAFHDQRFSDRGGSTTFFTPALRAFHDEATRSALDCGWLRMYVLRLNDAPAAVMYGFDYRQRFYFYQHGFDDQYKAHSVGLALMALSIQAALEGGAEEFDMLWGVEPYKRLWAHDARQLRQIHLFPAHLGGTIHRHAIQARWHLGRLARRVLTTGDTSAT